MTEMMISDKYVNIHAVSPESKQPLVVYQDICCMICINLRLLTQKVLKFRKGSVTTYF